MQLKRYRVLVVDAQSSHRQQILNMNLWGTGSRFEPCGEASDGAEALQMLSDGEYDIVITGIVMPRINGIELLKCIAESYPGIRVILINRVQDFEYARQGIIYGACDYLTNPVSEVLLDTALKRIERQICGFEDCLYRNTGLEEIADRISSVIREVGSLSEELILLYVNDLRARPGIRVLSGYGALVQGIRMVLERLLREYCRGVDMLLAAEALVRRNQGDGGALGCAIRTLKQVAEIYRELVLPHADHELVVKTVRLVLKRSETRKTVESIAQELFISRTYLSHVFRAHSGITLAEYLVRTKMYRGRMLLIKGDLSVAEVSQILGYKDEDHFSKLFRSHTGLSPREYRKQVCEKEIGKYTNSLA